MNKKTILIALGVIAVVGLGIWGVKASRQSTPVDDSAAVITSNFDSITSFTVEKPNLVIKGRDLSKIDIYGVPTGTNLNESDIKSLGTPTLQGTDNGIQTWIFPIPKNPMILTDIYVIGYDKSNKPSGSLSLGLVGATAINDALWGKGTTPAPTGTGGTQTSTSNPLRTLKVGGSASFGGLQVTLKSVDSDSRCPANVNCIQAGSVGATLVLTAAGKTTTQKIDSAKPLTASGYIISVETVAPAPIQGQKDYSKYELTLRIKQG